MQYWLGYAGGNLAHPGHHWVRDVGGSCPSFRHSDQKVLRREIGLSPAVGDAGIVPSAVQETRLLVVRHVGGKHLVFEALSERRIEHRAEHLDSFIEVAGHPVSARDVDLLVTAIFKIEDS